MTYDNELTLISKSYTEDEIGNQIPSESTNTILCAEKSIGRNEFYSAAVSDLKPEKIFIIHRYEYNNEKEILFEGKRYSVIRTYSADIEEIELVCERKTADVK